MVKGKNGTCIEILPDPVEADVTILIHHDKGSAKSMVDVYYAADLLHELQAAIHSLEEVVRRGK